jgi:hypothetical protein
MANHQPTASALTLTPAEVAAAVRFVARNRFWGVEAVLWAVCHSPGLIRTCLTTPPDPHAYTEIAGLDSGVQALLLASPESRSLLRSGIHSSPPAVRQRVKTTAPPASTVSLTLDDVIAAFHLVAWTRPSAIDALLWAVCQSPTLVAQLRRIPPDACHYVEVARLDGIVGLILSTSSEGLILLRGEAALADMVDNVRPQLVFEP